MKNSKTRFSATVKNYDQYRPSYPSKLIDWIISKTKIKSSDTVVDIGCGTGISTRLFADREFKVIGVDPNEDMLKAARKRGSSATYQKGDAENTNLKANSANLIISAQAFHWFAVDKTMKEFKRILKPGAFCVAFWNVRVKNPLTKKYEAIIKKYSGDYEKTIKAVETVEAIKDSKLIKLAKEKQFANTQSLDGEGLINRAYSTSYVMHGVKDHAGFKNQLMKLFRKFQKKGKITFDYKVLAIMWQL